MRSSTTVRCSAADSPAASRWSSPAEGSSKSSTVGLVASARPTSTSRDVPSGRESTSESATSVSERSSSSDVDPLLFGRIGLAQARPGEHVLPQPRPRVAGPVGEHEVLAGGQSQEQLGLLEGAGQPAAGPTLRARFGHVDPGEERRGPSRA